MADMLDLIDRLEAAEAGSRELDAAVCIAFNYVGAHQDFTPENLRLADDADEDDSWLDYEVAGDDCTDTTPRLTTSIDAALALAERLWAHVMWRVGHDPDDGSLKAELVTAQKPGDPPAVTANAATPALALCIAILKAIHHARTSTAGYEAAGEVSPNLKAKAQGEGG